MAPVCRFECPRIARGLLAALAVVLTATPAGAVFHIAHIHRILTGLDGTTDVQFVEIEMDALGQGVVDGSRLIAFDADGSFSHVVLVVDDNVASGSNRPWIMASAAFEAASGIAPDFVFDSSGGSGLPAEAGMVCWGKPGDETDPNDDDMVDCISYGDYTGAPNDLTSAPSPVTPFGRGLVRVGDEGSSALDFACEDPALPRNNDPTTGEIPASTPCPGNATCGNEAVEEPETCDDGDTEFVPGDFCSAECESFACGVPTTASSASPKTSDALFVLKAAVATSNCDVRVCDANGSGSVTSADALVILRIAVGQTVEPACPLV